jgi:hypothetical protein
MAAHLPLSLSGHFHHSLLLNLASLLRHIGDPEIQTPCLENPNRDPEN